MKLSQVFETSESLKSAKSSTNAHDVLMQMTVGEMADILRSSIANGTPRYIAMDWETEAAKKRTRRMAEKDLEAKLLEYYCQDDQA